MNKEQDESIAIEWLENPKDYFHASLSGVAGEVSAIYNKKDRVVAISRYPSEEGATETSETLDAMAEQLAREAKKSFGDDVAITLI